MQHHATAINASPQLDGSESPWQLRFGEEFPAMHIPFGAKVLFWITPRGWITHQVSSPQQQMKEFSLGITSNQVMIGRVNIWLPSWKPQIIMSTGCTDNPKNKEVGIAIRGFHLSFESSD